MLWRSHARGKLPLRVPTPFSSPQTVAGADDRPLLFPTSAQCAIVLSGIRAGERNGGLTEREAFIVPLNPSMIYDRGLCDTASPPGESASLPLAHPRSFLI
jgi:hypothetical protein